MKNLKNLLISLSAAFSIFGCASLNSVVISDPVVKSAASVATGTALGRIKDSVKQKKAADYVYSVAVGARTLNGQVPTSEELAATLATFSGGQDPVIVSLAATLSEIYADYYKQLAADNKNLTVAAHLLEDIAEGAEKGAASFK